MTLSLYDSKSQALRAFTPIVPGRVGIYVCGPTVQGAPHVGHLRSALVYDILRRWLEATGNKVTLVRNVTDIDDKVLENAKAEVKRAGIGYDELARRLTEMGVTETVGSVTVKVNRGTYPAWWLMAVMKALGRHTIRLDEPAA